MQEGTALRFGGHGRLEGTLGRVAAVEREAFAALDRLARTQRTSADVGQADGPFSELAGGSGCRQGGVA